MVQTIFKAFDFYADPGHGWLKVPKSLLRDLNIIHMITPYSYQRGEFAYLEEDQDAGTFVNAMLNQYGIVVKYREHVARERESKIRNYDQYDPKGGPDSAAEARMTPTPMYPICETCGDSDVPGHYGELPRKSRRRPDVRVRGYERRMK